MLAPVADKGEWDGVSRKTLTVPVNGGEVTV